MEARWPRRFQGGDAKSGPGKWGLLGRGRPITLSPFMPQDRGSFARFGVTAAGFVTAWLEFEVRSSPPRLKAALVIVAVGGHGNWRCFGNGSTNAGLRGARPSPGGRSARLPFDGVISCASVPGLSGLHAEAESASIT